MHTVSFIGRGNQIIRRNSSIIRNRSYFRGKYNYTLWKDYIVRNWQSFSFIYILYTSFCMLLFGVHLYKYYISLSTHASRYCKLLYTWENLMNCKLSVRFQLTIHLYLKNKICLRHTKDIHLKWSENGKAKYKEQCYMIYPCVSIGGTQFDVGKYY